MNVTLIIRKIIITEVEEDELPCRVELVLKDGSAHGAGLSIGRAILAAFEVLGIKDDTVTLTKADYKWLQEKVEWLECLEAAGVDNWQGIEFAYEMKKEYEEGVSPWLQY